jgi:cytochrome c oxidase subunit 4
MMAVSCTKAMLVILFFMHLLWEANWKYVLTIPAAMMSVFLVLMLVPDVGMRVRGYSEERLLHSADPVAAHEIEHHDDGENSAGPHEDGDH